MSKPNNRSLLKTISMSIISVNRVKGLTPKNPLFSDREYWNSINFTMEKDCRESQYYTSPGHLRTTLTEDKNLQHRD